MNIMKQKPYFSTNEICNIKKNARQNEKAYLK